MMEEDLKPRIALARNHARKCITKYALSLPIPIEDILINHYEFTIMKLDFKPTVSAMVDLDSRYIGINENHHPNRQRFTLAHELGHFCLGHESRVFTEYAVEPGQNKSIFEVEANEFAAELLMPSAQLKKLYPSSGVEELLNTFQVSKEALFYQLMKHRLV